MKIEIDSNDQILFERLKDLLGHDGSAYWHKGIQAEVLMESGAIVINSNENDAVIDNLKDLVQKTLDGYNSNNKTQLSIREDE